MSIKLTRLDEVRRVAREYAIELGLNETRAEAYAEIWLDAGKDDDASTSDALRSYLARRFAAPA